MKIYKDSKELPFFIYKRIMQTGDFLYMIKGYEEGDEIEDANLEELEIKFNVLIEDFVISMNESSEEIADHGSFAIANLESEKLSIAVGVIELLVDALEEAKSIGHDFSKEVNEVVKELLDGIKVERNPDLRIQKKKLIDKIKVHEINIERLREIITNTVSKESEESDLDAQFINVCLGLEIPFPDENKISLYQFSLMVKRVVEKVNAMEKLNTK